MKKTNVTFVQPSGWIASKVGQCMQWMLAGLMLFFVTASAMAQVAPNCTDVNAALDADGNISVAVEEFVTNCATAEPVDYTVYNQYGGVVIYTEGAACTDVISFNACNAIGRTYSVQFKNAAGSCWSELTFKQSNGPIVTPNAYYLYCLEEEVGDVGLYLDRFYGDNDGKYEPSVDYKGATVPCVYGVEATFVADWVTPYECVLGEDTAKVVLREFEAFDKNGKRGSAFDTLYVWRLPQLTNETVYCAEKDTVYCGVGDSPGPYMVVPQIDSSTGLPTGLCDTMPFLDIDQENGQLVCEPVTFDPKCGISVHVDKWKFEDPCSPQYKVTLEIKQTCYGAAQTACRVDPAAAGPGTPNAFEEIALGYWSCTFWIIDLDTLPPVADCKMDPDDLNVDTDHCYYTPKFPDGEDYCKAPVLVVPTGTHDCAAHTYIPPVCVYDDWSGIKQVKARIAGVGAWVLESNGETCDQLDNTDYGCDPDHNIKNGICYESHQSVKLAKSDQPYQIMYEIYDNCHNIDTIYGYILVKDRTRPVAVADKGVTVSLSSKKVWVDAETFDEGSWDNCGVNMLLARRADWYDFCIDLCDDTAKICEGKHGESIYAAFLNDDKKADEVEAHYAKTLDWLCNDGVPCGEIIYNAWLYDLAKYATLYCVDHPYEVDDAYFRHLFEACYDDYYGARTHQVDIDPSSGVEYYLDRFKRINAHPECDDVPLAEDSEVGGGLSTEELATIDLYEQIGGGWSEDVPFSCEDACGPVIVEILVMDYWCNWSKNWTKVWVEDKTPASVVKDVVDGHVYCATYKTARHDYPGEQHPVSAEWIVNQAVDGEQDAYDALDEIFGGYCKAWVDPYGNYVDADGNEIECDIVYSDSTCECTTYKKQIRVYDEHLGYLWVDSMYTECYYEDVDREFQKGIVAVNCAENVQCSQTVWADFDHCGQGYIYRKWKIWQGCPPNDDHTSGHIPDTIFRVQKIKVGNECAIRKQMFDVPGDMDVYSCGIEYDEDGSGNVSGAADPSVTGHPTYKFDDDCRIVGIGYEDKVFKIVGGDQGCYKIIRTWYFADWCTDGYYNGADLGYDGYRFWRDRGYDDYCVQKIIVYDTMPPACTITGPVEDGGTIQAAGCEYDFHASATMSDACGVISYYWELKDLTKEPHELVASGSGELNSETEDDISMSVEGLTDGDYKLKVRTTDDCQNESYCEYNFTLETGKKPTPVCITSLTVELTPWDTDNDGEADTAAAEVWASEFDRSSQAPCGYDHDDLDFRIEFLGDDSDSLDLDEDEDVLYVGCEHAGTQMVRLWVISPTGSFDYCDVLLVVQTNMDGCGDVSAVRGVVTTELNNNVEQVEVTATLESGQVLNSVTSVEGAYQFATNVIGEKVTITPKKDIGWDNGVSTLDLVKIQKHILGKATLESDLRKVAADVNFDGKVSALDLLEIRKLILGKTDQFANVGSWKFFSRINNEESYVIDGIAGMMEIDWTGVKMGDVDHSNDPSRSAGRSGKSLVFNVDNAELIAGNQYKVDFKAGNFNDITGYQFTINFDNSALKVLNVESGVLEVGGDNFGLDRMEEGIVTTSWNAGEGMSIATDEVVFSLIVEAKDVVSLSNALTVNSKVTAAEAYNSADQIHEVSLNFTSDLTEAGFALYQNEPNPFKESTRVSFNLPEAMSATLTIYDVTGKVLKVIENDYSKGYNQVSVEQKDLKVTGVLYYQLDTESFTATKRMIIVD